MVGAGVAGCLILIVYTALDIIVTGVIQAAVILFWILVAALIIGAGVIIYIYWQREQVRLLRLIDGAFPLQRFKLLDGTPILIDPNKMISAGGAVHPTQGWGEFIPNGGWDNQRQLALEVHFTRHLAAMFPGDAAQEKTQGAIEAPKISAATTKLLIGPTEKAAVVPVAVSSQLALPAPTIQPFSAADALAKSTGSKWIVGQSDDGQLATFEPERHFSAGIVGATGTGKTSSVGFLMVLAALRAGWHVVVVNPDGNCPPPNGGPGWHLFEKSLELHETDPR